MKKPRRRSIAHASGAAVIAWCLVVGASGQQPDADAPDTEPKAVAIIDAEEGAEGPLHRALEDLLGDLGAWRFTGAATASFTFDPANPAERRNFGRLFDDRPQRIQPNRISLTAERPVIVDPTGYGWGAKLTALFGSDARYTTSSGLLDDVSDDLAQPDLFEAYVVGHAPWLARRGIEFKAGVFPSLCGLESADPSSNILVSRSFIFNFGVPFKHLGALAIVYPHDDIDLFGGLVRGANTGFVDNNDAWSLHGGAAWRALGGDLTLGLGALWGPENPTTLAGAGVEPDEDDRLILDLATTVSLTERWSLLVDLNYGRDGARLGVGGVRPEWYGAAATAVYAASSRLDVALRAEVFRDADGFAVAQFGAYDDYADVLLGRTIGLDPRTRGGGRATYLGATIGLSWRVAEACSLQAEVRYDQALGATPFDGGAADSRWTMGFAVTYRF